MRSLLLITLLAALPIMAGAKGKTVRIEISDKQRTVLSLSDPQLAGKFNVWSGPGTSSGTHTSSSDYADWASGTVRQPANPDVYLVRFYCKTPNWLVPEKGADFMCTGVRYAIDRETGKGYIQIPPYQDVDFPPGTQAIHHGVEGSWYRATPSWEKLVRPAIEQARTASR